MFALIGSPSSSVHFTGRFLAVVLTMLRAGLPPNMGQPDPPGWPMFGGSPARNMVNTTARNLPVKWTDDEGDPIKANILWSADLGSRANGGPIVAGGKVFVGTNNQNPRNPNDVWINP